MSEQGAVEWPDYSWTFGERAGRLGFLGVKVPGSEFERRQAGRDGMRFFAADFIRTTPKFLPVMLRIKAVL
jgi:hypothetical protein